MVKQLKKTYFILVVPAILLTVLLFFMNEYNLWNGIDYHPDKTISIIIFVLAITIGVALPIFFRVLNFNKLRDKKSFTINEFVEYQKKLLFLVSFTPYIAVFAALLRLDSFYFTGTALAALYAIYYHFPSEKKINFDKKIFKVQE